MKLNDTGLEKPLHSRLMNAIYEVSNKSIVGGREGKAAKELTLEIEKGKFTEQDVYDCIAWAKVEKFNTFAVSLVSIQKLMPNFLLINEAAKIVENDNEALGSFERIKIVTEILKQQTKDYGFTKIKTAEKFRQEAEALLKHLDRAKIPSDKLWEVYYEACAVKEETSFWSPTIYLKGWDALQRKENQKPTREDHVCGLCKDNMIIKTANPETGKEKEMPCPLH